MKKIILLGLLLSSFLAVQAQSTRLGSCANNSDGKRFYVTIYGAPGIGKYKFEPVSFQTEKKYFESKSLFSMQGGISFHYRFDRFNLGIGGVYHSLSGKMNEDSLNNEKVSLQLYKVYASLEVPFYSDSFADFGWGVNAGTFMPKGHYYTNPKMPLFFETGLYYNIILNSYSSIMTKLYYGKSFFETTAISQSSQQQTGDVSLQVGFRFWF